MAGSEHGHFCPQGGEFSANVGGETMVHCRGICAAKERASRALCGSGAESSTKGIRDNPDGGTECAAERPA